MTILMLSHILPYMLQNPSSLAVPHQNQINLLKPFYQIHSLRRTFYKIQILFVLSMRYETNYQNIEKRLENASKFFLELENRWSYKSGHTPIREAAIGIKDCSGNTICPNEAFKILLGVMDELDGYSPKMLENIASKGIRYVGTLAMVPLMYSYERTLANNLHRNLNTLTLDDITEETDFLRYALIIAAYKEIFRHEII